MLEMSAEEKRIIEDAAKKHGVSSDAIATLINALIAGGGRMAQFNHPELGGMGQWSQGGMFMIGDMFNNDLKRRVEAICIDLSQLVANQNTFAPTNTTRSSQSQYNTAYQSSEQNKPSFSFGNNTVSRETWWPAHLGVPSSIGSQNETSYAYFESSRRLAINYNKQVTIFDCGDHKIKGFSQQQGRDHSITFTSQHGLVSASDLTIVSKDPA